MDRDLHGRQEKRTPRISDALIFRAKATLLQIRRAAGNLFDAEIERFPKHAALAGKSLLAESKTPLWTETEKAEKHLVAGKVHNLRLALSNLNGVEVPANRVFSFWKQLGRASRRKGYVAGRELREGCIIASVGGGLCQLSNALYDAALRAGFQIIERHAHTQVVAGSLAEAGRDATIFWNYVDLRFKSEKAFRIEATMDADSLIVRLRGETVTSGRQGSRPVKIRSAAGVGDVRSCASCGVAECFRHVEPLRATDNFGRGAYLVDEYWPEFDRYIGARRNDRDLLCLPLDGKVFGKANYAWTTEGFGTVKQSRLLTALRSYRSRRLAAQGAARQRALLDSSEKLAQRYASLLPYDVRHVTLMQNLLPYLWREGHLGGRTFDVLMTALPLAQLHERLDRACALNPESKTLADFRADDWLLEAESEALMHARRIVTPHTEIAALYPDRAMLLDWAVPPPECLGTSVADRAPKLVFPGPTVGRKGAYELRAALAGTDIRLTIMGAQLEGEDFWAGLEVERQPCDRDWLESATAVVLPAFVEHKPRRLLQAVARGVPVIASTACGLEHVPGVISIRPGDVESLRVEIEKVIARSPEKISTPPLCLAQA